VKEGFTDIACEISIEQSIFHYSVDDMTPIYSLPHETLLAHRTCDKARAEISPKEVLRLNYCHGTLHEDIAWRRIYPSWDEGRVILWRTQTALYEGPRLIASVHDISGSGPFEIPTTPTQPCPDEDILMDMPLDILGDDVGFRLHHGGFSGKAIAWLTTELTLVLLEIPPVEGRGTSCERAGTRSWRIPSSVGLDHHGDVIDIWLDDARGRVILAMQDETLIIFEFA
jgi:hypothetical protein